MVTDIINPPKEEKTKSKRTQESEVLKCPRCRVEIEITEVGATEHRPRGKIYRCPICKVECFDGAPPDEKTEPSKTAKKKAAKKKAAKKKPKKKKTSNE